MWHRKMLRWLRACNTFLLTPVVLAVLCMASCDTGVLVVDDPNDIQALTEEGAKLVAQDFSVTPVKGAQAYKLEIASDVLFEVILYSRNDFSSPELTGEANLDLYTTYYWRGAARKNWVWGYPTESRSFSLLPSIGDIGPAGGIVFYDKGKTTSGWRFLEAWTDDEPGSYSWKTRNTRTNGTSLEIGTGYTNTYNALAGTAHPAAEAARIANHGGYTDWFLPSKNELSVMYEIIGPKASTYWSSSEHSDTGAWLQRFINGSQYVGYKFYEGTGARVRVVRAF